MQKKLSNKLLLMYYDATVVFLALDFLFGINVRLSFLETMPAWRTAYYLFCIACAVLMHWRPDITIFVSAIEGLITILWLIISMYLGYLMAGVESLGDMFQVLLNYFISGYFAQLSWRQGLEALGSRSVKS